MLDYAQVTAPGYYSYILPARSCYLQTAGVNLGRGGEGHRLPLGLLLPPLGFTCLIFNVVDTIDYMVMINVTVRILQKCATRFKKFLILKYFLGVPPDPLGREHGFAQGPL